LVIIKKFHCYILIILLIVEGAFDFSACVTTDKTCISKHGLGLIFFHHCRPWHWNW
jgi:hypothetical protein